MNHTVYAQGVSDLNIKIDIQKGSSVPSSHKSFSPSKITIDKGVTVKWTNKDSTLHTITSGKPQSSDTGEEFDSSFLAAGTSFEYTFDNAGTYDYFCTLHPYMKGKVVVSTNTGVIKTAEKQTPETIDTSFDTNTNVTQIPTSNITANDFATAADTEGAPDTEGISFKVQLKPHKLLADQGWYELAKSINGITNSSTICSSSADCKFVVTEGQMNPNIAGFDEYTFSGRVKVTTSVDGDAI